MTDRSKLIARCTLCASEFSQDDLDGVNACPVCGHGGLPMPIDADVKVAVNWHELRILGMWAENWAVQHKEKHYARTGGGVPKCTVCKTRRAVHRHHVVKQQKIRARWRSLRYKPAARRPTS
jgi:DNA-directed RNA polymerase subunit RPC12/RpoP